MIKKNSKSNIFFNHKFFFISIPTILTAALPLFLITGPFLPDLSVSICAILFIINSYKNSLTKYYKSYFFLYFIFFYIILIMSSLLSSEIIFSLKTSIPYVRFGIFSLSTWYLIDNNKKFLNYLLYAFLISFFFLITDGYTQFLTGKNLLGNDVIATRISSLFGDELIMGSYISRLFPIFFALCVYLKALDKNKYLYIFLIMLFILSELLIFLSGERAALFYLNLSAFFSIILIKKYKLTRFFSLITCFVLFFLISSVDNKYKVRIVDQTLIELGIKDNKKITYIFSSVHQDLYNISLSMFLESKAIGMGPKYFKKKCIDYMKPNLAKNCSTHPHNNYIQLLAETGLLGFLIFSFIFILVIYFSLKHFFLLIFRKKYYFNDYQIFLLSAILITFWPFVPTGNLFNNWLNVIYYLPAGIFVSSLNKKFI